MPFNPKSLKNLRSSGPNKWTKAERAANGRKGNEAQQESKKRRKELVDTICVLMKMKVQNGSVDAVLKSMGIEANERTNITAFVVKLYTMAMNGDLVAAKLLIELGGLSGDEQRKEDENWRKNQESVARIKAMEAGIGNVTSNDDEDGGVVIYMPELDKEEETDSKKE